MDDRYSRQVLFSGLREAGQARLGRGSVLLVGCGALGSHAADLLVRSGVGRIRIADRDFVESSNLHRQSLFDEADVREGLPKAVAAARRLGGVNSEVEVEGFAEHVDAEALARLAGGVGLILDGTDNFETRLLINDYALKHRLPWIYAACLGSYGVTMNVLPGDTPCFRCLLPALPPPGSVETCETAGVIAPIAALIASVQAGEAIKILSGAGDAVSRDLLAVDLWSNSVQRIAVSRDAMSGECRACAMGLYDFLEGDAGSQVVTLCGRNAVQIHVRRRGEADLKRLAGSLGRYGEVVHNRYLVRAEVEGCVLAVFRDGRAIVSGTQDPARARSLYDRYVGA
ncbi:MAG: ThiF family adenylyltransferase [Acidobacteriota bacterium]